MQVWLDNRDNIAELSNYGLDSIDCIINSIEQPNETDIPNIISNGNSIIKDDEVIGQIININGSEGQEFHSGAGNDDVYGQKGDDKLYGDSGNDNLLGGTGSDELHGGSGNDILKGESEHDLLFGDDGSDQLLGGTGNDTLYGGNDNDTLSGDAGHDLLSGDSGDDLLSGGEGNDALYGGIGDDILDGGLGHDYLDGGDGDDLIKTNEEDKIIKGGEGKDRLSFASSSAAVSFNIATQNVDIIGNGSYQVESIESATGSDFDDILIGDSGDNLIDGGKGNDTIITGEGGNDILTGGEGEDRFIINEKSIVDAINEVITITDFDAKNNEIINIEDFVDGIGYSDLNIYQGTEPGNKDDVYIELSNAQTIILKNTKLEDISYKNFEFQATTTSGTAQNDTLIGSTYDDNLSGGDGDDTLIAREGDDTLTGNAGVDTFVITKNANGTDTITDYTQGEIIDLKDVGDIIHLDQATITQNGNDTIIHLFDNQRIILENFNKEDFFDYNDERKTEVINALLDIAIRPALANDGGGINLLSVQDKTIKVHYQGACGSCPSSTTGTLQYIEQFLKEAIHPDVEVQAN